MIKKLLILAVLTVHGPALAITKPTDSVNILYSRFDAQDSAIETENKTYSKPYSQLKLDDKTRAQITALNSELDRSSGGIEKYRLIWIRIVNDQIQGYMFQGSRSSTWVIEPASQSNNWQHRYMHLGLDGNGGLACRNEKPYQD
jgi:hypothetical protein